VDVDDDVALFGEKGFFIFGLFSVEERGIPRRALFAVGEVVDAGTADAAG
jgi:hypothetical protein